MARMPNAMEPRTWEFIHQMQVKPFGVPIAQTWYQIGLVFSLIDTQKIVSFVEVGMFLGGLSDMLIRRMDTVGDIAFIGFEIDEAVLGRGCMRVRNHPSTIIADAWDNPAIARTSAFIRERKGKAFIYCDGGNKMKELRLYATVLRPGDLIMCHDYPGESTPESLDDFGKTFTYMTELDPVFYRDMGVTLWVRNA